MRLATEILADQLVASLSEACCGECGSMSKQLGKKVCCGGHKEEEKPAPKTEAADRHTHPFIKRCVAAMTGKEGSKDPHKPAQLSSAFAICVASKKKHPGAAKEKAKEGVPEKKMAAYEKALSVARKARAKK